MLPSSCLILASSLLCISFLSSRTPALVVKPRGSEYHASYQSQGRASYASAHCILVLELLRKTQHSQALDETMLYPHREETKQDQFIHQFLWLQGPSPSPATVAGQPLSCSKTPTLKLVECLRAIAIHA